MPSVALQRICRADYQVPPGVELTPEFEELLQGMLQPDPSLRMAVGKVLRHPWFAEGLPPGVADMNARLPDGPRPGEGQVRVWDNPSPEPVAFVDWNRAVTEPEMTCV